MDGYRVTRYVRNEAGELIVWVPPWKIPHVCRFTDHTRKCVICDKPLSDHLKVVHSLRGESKWVTNHPNLPKQSGVRAQVFKRDNYCCVYCKSKENLTIDHIKPLSLGGKKNNITNLQVLCYPCNQKKGNKYPYNP